MRTPATLLLAGLPLLLALGCFEGPKVVQGKVLGIDPSANLVTIEDELPPNHHLAVDTTSAQLGSALQIGSVVRVAYHVSGERLVAARVMTVRAPEGKAGSAR